MNSITTRKDTRKRPSSRMPEGGVVVLRDGVEIGFVFDKLYGTYSAVMNGKTLCDCATRKHAVEQIVIHSEARSCIDFDSQMA